MSPEREIAKVRANLIARYRMHSIPGRPEELETNGNPRRVVSFAYAGGELRIRKHGGPKNRDWAETRDFRIGPDLLGRVLAYLDPQFLPAPTPADVKPRRDPADVTNPADPPRHTLYPQA